MNSPKYLPSSNSVERRHRIFKKTDSRSILYRIPNSKETRIENRVRRIRGVINAKMQSMVGNVLAVAANR